MQCSIYVYILSLTLYKEKEIEPKNTDNLLVVVKDTHSRTTICASDTYNVQSFRSLSLVSSLPVIWLDSSCSLVFTVVSSLSLFVGDDTCGDSPISLRFRFSSHRKNFISALATL